MILYSLPGRVSGQYARVCESSRLHYYWPYFQTLTQGRPLLRCTQDSREIFLRRYATSLWIETNPPSFVTFIFLKNKVLASTTPCHCVPIGGKIFRRNGATDMSQIPSLRTDWYKIAYRWWQFYYHIAQSKEIKIAHTKVEVINTLVGNPLGKSYRLLKSGSRISFSKR